MALRLKLLKGTLSLYFLFRPAIIKKSDKILFNDVVEFENEFSIEEGDIGLYLGENGGLPLFES